MQGIKKTCSKDFQFTEKVSFEESENEAVACRCVYIFFAVWN